MAKGIKFKNTYVAPYFPIGFTILMANDTDPSTWLGGTWQRVAKGKAIVGVDENDTDFNTTGKIGGEKTHALVKSEIPHIGSGVEYGGSGIASGSGWSNTWLGSSDAPAHNNLQPYMTFYIWTRIK